MYLLYLQLENLARDDPTNVTLDELLDKLHNTESKLGFWQNLRRDEAYNNSIDGHQTEATVKLHFLRDAMFHYLTDKNDSLEHLRAMMGIIDVTEPQKRKIEKALSDKKKKKLGK